MPRSFATLHRPARALGAGLGLLVALAACGGEVAVTGPNGRGLSGGEISGGGTTTPTATLTGRWTRTLLYEDSWGGYVSSETTWEFAADGVATRVNIVRDYAYGTSDVTVASARWSISGTTMQVRYVSPDAGTVRFRWRIERFSDGDVLWLDDTRFVRVYR